MEVKNQVFKEFIRENLRLKRITLVAVPAIKISFCLRISCLFFSFSTVKTIEPNLVSGLCFFILNKIYLGSLCIAIGLKVSISSFRSLDLPSLRKGRVGIPWAMT